MLATDDERERGERGREGEIYVAIIQEFGITSNSLKLSPVMGVSLLIQ